MLYKILYDALLAAIAAIGFSAISRPPRHAYFFCALLAAAGHALRFALMGTELADIHIIPATIVAATVTGVLAVLVSPIARMPAEACLFPALLPMIPGIYAYKAFGALALCMLCESKDVFWHNFYLFSHNAITCTAVLLCLVAGGSIPVFIFKNLSFSATRH